MNILLDLRNILIENIIKFKKILNEILINRFKENI
jgi:hypothetical protein